MNSTLVWVTDFEVIQLKGKLADRLTEIGNVAAGDGRNREVRLAREKTIMINRALNDLSQFAYGEDLEVRDLFK